MEITNECSENTIWLSIFEIILNEKIVDLLNFDQKETSIQKKKHIEVNSICAADFGEGIEILNYGLSKKSGEKSHVVLVIKIIQENGTTVYSRVDVDVQP